MVKRDLSLQYRHRASKWEIKWGLKGGGVKVFVVVHLNLLLTS